MQDMNKLTGYVCGSCHEEITEKRPGKRCATCHRAAHDTCARPLETALDQCCPTCGVSTKPRSPASEKGSDTYPVSSVCPSCGHTGYALKKPKRVVAFRPDRVCSACWARYIPPTPRWAAVLLILAGCILAGAGGVGLIGHFGAIAQPMLHLLMLPAIVFELGMVLVGCFALVQGVRAILRPGRV
jgi:hypothetical protein